MPAKPKQPRADLDLDTELGELDLSPVKVRLGGVIYTIRRDFTAPEIRDYWAKAAAKDDAAALGVLVDDPELGTQLNEALEAMPQKRMMLALRKLMVAAGLLDEAGEKQGEAQAS